MMAALVSTPTDLQIMEAIQSWVMTVTGLDIDHVVQAFGNRVPEPVGPWAMISSVSRKALFIPTSTYINANPIEMETVAQGYDCIYQIDCYGNGAADLAFMLQTMFRSEVTGAVFEVNDFEIEPLFCDDATHTPLVNEESQYEERWILRPHFHIVISVGTPMQFMSNAAVGIVSVETLPR